MHFLGGVTLLKFRTRLRLSGIRHDFRRSLLVRSYIEFMDRLRRDGRYRFSLPKFRHLSTLVSNLRIRERASSKRIFRSQFQRRGRIEHALSRPIRVEA